MYTACIQPVTQETINCRHIVFHIALAELAREPAVVTLLAYLMTMGLITRGHSVLA